MKKKLIIAGVILVVLVILGTVAAKFITNKKNDKKANRIEVARRGEFIVKLRETGNLEPLISVQVKSNVYGEIEKIFVENGDVVERKQPLIKVNDKQIREQKVQAEADLSAAKAQYEQSKKRTKLTQERQATSIKEAKDAIETAKLNYEATLSNSKQQISQAETEIESTIDMLEQDKISLKQAKISLGQAQLTLSQYKSAEKSAKIALDNAKSELERKQELYEKEYVSKKALEDTKTQYANAQSQYESAQKRVESQEETIKSHRQSIKSQENAIKTRRRTLESQRTNLELLKDSRKPVEKQAEIGLRTARTRLEQLLKTSKEEEAISVFSETSAHAAFLRTKSLLKNAKEQLEWTTIKSPMSGTITNLVVEEGEIVVSGSSGLATGPALMTISDLSQMIVKTWINEVDIRKVKIGQKAEIKVGTYPDKKFEGRVSKIAPSGQIQENVIKFEVEIEVAGSPKELHPGMTADVDVIVVNRNNVLQLPIEAVIDEEVVTVKVTVPESQLSKLEVDKEVEVENLAGKKFKGEVGEIDRSKRRGNVEVLLDKETKGMRSGPREIAIVLSENKSIKGLQANVTSEEKHFVMLYQDKSEDKDDEKKLKGEKTRVEVGDRNNHNIEIKSGIREDDKVVIKSISELIKKEEK